MAKKNREINVFSTSAIDLFASSLGVFIVLVIIIMPYFRKTSEAPPILLKLKIKEKTEEVVQLRKKIEELEEEVVEVKSKVVENETDAKQVKNQEVVLQEKVKELEKIQKKLEQKTQRVQQLEDSTQEQAQKIAQIQQKLKKEQRRRQVASVKPVTETVPIEEFEAQKKIEELLKKQIKQLKDEIKREEMKRLEGAFVAVVIKWPTVKHDIDLAVKDPRGKVFNFKKRKHAGSPGNFSLDSRTGPGAEIWQSPTLLPGKYELTYSFYNPYGNAKPAEIFGTIFTKDGSVELPKVKLDFKKKRKATLAFKVSADHGVSLIYKGAK